MSAQAIPDVYDSLIPSLTVKDAAHAIEFYKDVFGATELMRMTMPGSSKIAHAEIQIRGHVLMLHDENPHMGIMAPQPDGKMAPASVMIYVADVDATYNKALSKGARAFMPVTDMFWGDRFGKFIDPFGHFWAVATHMRDVSPEECEKAMAEWAKQSSAV